MPEEERSENTGDITPSDPIEPEIPELEFAWALTFARSVVTTICLSVATLIVIGGILTLGSGRSFTNVITALFIVGQISGLIHAYRRAQRSDRPRLILIGGIVVVLLWIMSVGLCTMTEQSL